MTIIGAIFVPVAISIFLFAPFYLVPLLILSSVFEMSCVYAGAIGKYEFGLTASYFVEILILIRLLLLGVRDNATSKVKARSSRSVLIALLVFAGWCVASSFLMPLLFAGMPVYAPRDSLEVSFSDLAALHWNMGNLAQAIFLSLHVSAVIYAVYTVRSWRNVKTVERAFLISVYIVLAAFFVQLVFPEAYPYKLLNNSPTYYLADLDYQEIGGFQRIAATFGEPSSAGVFLSGVAVGLIASCMAGRRHVWDFFLIALTMFALVYTTSTVGYAAFIVAFCALTVSYLVLNKARRGNVFKQYAMLIVTVSAAVAILLTNVVLFQTVSSVTVGKTETVSFAHRLLADLYAVILVKDTFGLGVGLGSSRSSSLLLTMLSTVGVVGVALAVWFLARLKELPRCRITSVRPTMQLSYWALVGAIIACCIGFPDLTRPSLWSLIVVIGVQFASYRERIDAHLLPARDRQSA